MKTEKDRIYTWGVILDCSAPYYNEKSANYQCTFKLIDDSLVGSKSKSAPEYLTATMFSKIAAEFPSVIKVGTIIRIHRGETKKHKDQMILNINITRKAAWIIFDPYDGLTPIAQKGKHYTYTEKDKAALKSLRKFVKEYFEKKDLEGMSLKDAEKKKPKDFDTICYVLDVKAKGKEEKVKLCDGSKIVKLSLPINRKGAVAAQDIVHIRSVNIEKGGKEISLNEYSSVLRIPKEYAAAKALLKELQGPKVDAEIKKELSLVMDTKGETTKLLKKNAKPISLKELFAGKNIGGTNKVHVSVVDVGPKDPHDWICVVEKKTGKQFKLSEVFSGKKAKGPLPDGMAYYLKMQFFVKDKSGAKDSNMYTLFLCTVEGKGKEFIKLNLGKEYPSEEEYKNLKKVYKMLTRAWVEMDLVVESVEASGKQPVVFIVDTELNC